MRLVGRIIAILAAAMVVVAIAFGVSRTSAAQSWAANGQRHHEMTQAANSSVGSTAAGSTQQAGPRGERGGGFAAFEVVKNLVVVALIVAVVALIKRVLPKQRSRRGIKPQSMSAVDPAA